MKFYLIENDERWWFSDFLMNMVFHCLTKVTAWICDLAISLKEMALSSLLWSSIQYLPE